MNFYVITFQETANTCAPLQTQSHPLTVEVIITLTLVALISFLLNFATGIDTLF